jgi:hypothetical protein
LSLGERPDPFIGIEFRCIGGKVLDGETWMLAQELAEWFPLVGGGIIQQHNDRAAQVPQQLTQKNTNLFLSDVVVKKQIVEAQSMSLRA